SPRTPPSSSLSSSASCSPRQMPSVRPRRARSASLRPVSVSAFIALRAEPTPGRTVRSAPATAAGSAVANARAPSRSNASRGERVVHRHDGVAVTRDPAPVAEHAVQSLAQGERGVLRGVVRPGLEIAGALEHEIEAAVERELLEQVVVESRAGVDTDEAASVE